MSNTDADSSSGDDSYDSCSSSSDNDSASDYSSSSDDNNAEVNEADDESSSGMDIHSQNSNIHNQTVVNKQAVTLTAIVLSHKKWLPTLK